MISPASDASHNDTGSTMSLMAYRRAVDTVAATLGSDLAHGLSAAEAQRRFQQYGPNELESIPPDPWWRKLLAQFQDTLVILLIIATFVSLLVWFYERESPLPYEAIAIFSIVVLNGILGFVQEERAEQAVAALRAMAAQQATVLRGGERQRILASEIVPGDLLFLEEGDTIPADARLVTATGLQTAEAALTGESLPVSKTAQPIDEEEVEISDQHNMVFSSTAVTYGRGSALVVATGMQTEVGKVAGLLQQTQDEETPLQEELDRVGRLLGIVVIVIAVIIVGAILIVGGITDVRGFVDVLILGVALAVAAVPEGLPAIVTAVLAIGVQRMVKRNAIIRKLPAVETLGSATVIASDKTGTLTRNEMTVRTVVTASGCVDVSGIGYAPEGVLSQPENSSIDANLQQEAEKALRAADRANNAVLQEHGGHWTIQGDPTEGALLVAAQKAGLDPDDLEDRFARVGEVPFSSERKLMSTVHTDTVKPERLIVFAKGAPDVLLARCTHERVGDEAWPLTDERRAAIQASIEELAGAALRTLGVAFRSLPVDALEQGTSDAIEHELVFLGLVGMIDPPRPEAAEAVQKAKAAGIRPIMITGDHPRTAAAIATELGIMAGERVVIGTELERMSDEKLTQVVRDVSVYARVKPEHKLRIVQALQHNGEVVAMTGDGVNDAPALKAADIGVAMGITGTDVSKEAADMVLTDDNFASIVAAVEEGRSIFANIQKFLRFLLSSNVGEVLTMFFGVILTTVIGLGTTGDGAVVLPLLAVQLLWVNLVTDGPPALALGVDPPDPNVMQHPPRAQSSGVITTEMWVGIVLVGLVMAAGTLLVLDASLPGGLIEGTGELPYARTMALSTLILFQLFNVFNARSDTESVFHKLFANRWLWGAVALSFVLHLVIIYVPFMQVAFETVPLSMNDWLLCIVVASSVVVIREVSKLVGRFTLQSSPST